MVKHVILWKLKEEFSTEEKEESISKLSYQALVKILEEEDLSSLEKVPGVGKKTAQKMLLSLKGKLSLDVENSTSFGNSKKSSFGQL